MDLTFTELIGAWIAIGLTLGLYSFLYKDNPIYKFCEHVYVGVGTGYMVIYMALQFVWPKLLYPLSRVIWVKMGRSLAEPLDPDYDTLWLLVPLFFCICMGLRFFPKTSWMSRWAFAFFVGYTAGVSIAQPASAQIYEQVKSTLTPLWVTGGGWQHVVRTGIILMGVLSVLVYFFFSVEHKGAVRVVSRIGIVYLMIAFGAAFGYTVMARESLLIGRVMELDRCSRGNYGFATWILLAAIAITIAVLEMRKKPTAPPSA